MIPPLGLPDGLELGHGRRPLAVDPPLQLAGYLGTLGARLAQLALALPDPLLGDSPGETDGQAHRVIEGLGDP